MTDRTTLPLAPTERETLQQWLRGHLVKDDEGNPINHRIWFKNIFNPFLRSMGWVIVTKLENDAVKGYEVRKYNK